MSYKKNSLFQKIQKIFSSFFVCKTNIETDILELQEMENNIAKIREEISKRTLEITPHWNDIEPFCGFSDVNKKHLLIADDNKGVADLIKSDLEELMLNKNNSNSLEINKNNTEIVAIVDSLAPYRIMKTCEVTKDICVVDYAIIDIVFGDFVVKDGELLYMDGIDIVKYLQDINPNIKTCLFTGCYLSEASKEREKIIEKLGKDYLENNILEKTPFISDRLKFYKKFFGQT
jgi:CheY-like chemotaxis protein